MEQDGPAHDPFLLGDMEAACDRIEQAIAAGERICVHGDYDVDGDLRDRARRAGAGASSAPTSSGTCPAASRRATASASGASSGSPPAASAC